MNWLVRSSLEARWLVVILACVGLGIGLSQLPNLPLDVFPEFAPPVVEIQTEAPGIATEQVESLITVPIENALNGIPFVTSVRSKSVLGLSSVRLIFADGTNLLTARQLVQERLTIVAGSLPTVAKSPHILPPLSSLSRALKIGIWSDTKSQMEMTTVARWTIRPRLMSVPGVANVAIWGQRDPELQVVVSPEQLRLHHLTLDQLLQSTRDAVTPGPGGFLDTANQRLAIRHEPAVHTPQDLSEVVVSYSGGVALRIGDVAEVRTDFAPPIGDAIINGRPGLLLIVEKQPWANTLDVTTEVERVMHTLEPAMAGISYDSTIFRPATFIQRAIGNVTHSMAIGCALVLLVLISFLFDWRSAVISATAIPLSIVGALMVLRWYGATVNTMVLAGLTIALGEVVDDAIIDVENIVRRLRQNATAEPRASTMQVVLAASMEVRSSVVFATMIVILTFLPVFFLKGLAGSFFRPLAQAYILAILASLVVALTVTPALSLIFSSGMTRVHRSDGPLVRALKRVYERWLPALVRRPRWALAAIAIAFLPLVGLAPQLGEELMPKFKETDFLMHWVEKPGIGIDAMDRITIRASDELLTVPGVRNFGSHIGRAEVADEVVGPNFTELWISLDEKVDYDQTVARVQEIVDGYPGLYRDLLTYLSERIKEVLSGTSASMVVRVFGPDLDQLRTYAQEVAHEMEQVPGVTTLKVEPQVLVPQISIRIRHEALVHYGMTPGRLMQSVGTLLNGARVGEIYQEQRIQSVVVRGQDTLRGDVTNLYGLMIDTPAGAQVPLKELAEIQVVPAPNEIKREGASRRIDISCNASGRDLGSVAREIEDRVREKIRFASGYHPEFLGEYAEARASRQRMITVSLLSLLGIVVVLFLDFRSWRILVLIGISIPLALLGGIGGAYACNRILSLGSIVGFVTVLGVAIRNMIMLVSHYRHLVEEERQPWDLTTLVHGASERLAPILMTTLTAGLALVPLIFTGNIPGQEIEYPMAFVILGGLLTSTVVNLLLLPVLLYVFVPTKAWARDAN